MSNLAIAERQMFATRLAALRSIDPGELLPGAERRSYDIRHVCAGGVVRFDGNTYLVQNVATYQEMNESWTKTKTYQATELTLFCLESGDVHYIEWSLDDGLEIMFTERKIPRRELGSDLRYENGETVDVSDIDELAEQEEILSLQGRHYSYDDDWSARFKSDDGRMYYVYLCEFEGKNGQWLTIEAWTDTPKSDEGWEYEAYLSVAIRTEAIEVLCVGKHESGTAKTSG